MLVSMRHNTARSNSTAPTLSPEALIALEGACRALEDARLELKMAIAEAPDSDYAPRVLGDVNAILPRARGLLIAWKRIGAC